jgi:glycosyltransferase involved in cell wall biosynthesis
MATGRPVIGNARPEMFEDLFGEPSPICQAQTPEEVCAQLKRLVYDPVERERIGVAGRKYVEKYFNPKRSAEKIIEILRTALTASKGQTSHRLAIPIIYKGLIPSNKNY